ncbi:hypothetical protein B0A49_06478 [Cryomyces minteri]|uniref:Uncharacterized protein n=1 Tax=Cryomyces minteri TaxID=331657 RepID=A0A4U0X0Q2_9PEZI|nr:hypothetical protein B0A49_06478 [Cryomyces minteri]
MANSVAVPVEGSAHVDERSKEQSKEESEEQPREQSNASFNEELKVAIQEAVQSEDTATVEDEAAHRRLDELREPQERQRKRQKRLVGDPAAGIPHTVPLEYQEIDGNVIHLEALTDQEATENVISAGLVERLQLADKTCDEFDENTETLEAAGREASPRTWVRLHYKVRSDGDCFEQSFRVHYGAPENDLVLGVPALTSMYLLSQHHPHPAPLKVPVLGVPYYKFHTPRARRSITYGLNAEDLVPQRSFPGQAIKVLPDGTV